LREIFYEALVSTSRFPRWWIFALAQAALLYWIGELLQPRHLLRPFSVLWLLLAVLVMAPVTVWLWKDIEARKAGRENQILIKHFLGYCSEISVIILCSAALLVVAKLIYPDWLFSALVSSLISATATLAILYIVLCGQPFDRALSLALDTWNKKISLAALVAFVLLLAHGISFALVHGFLRDFMTRGGFSISGDFVTIWVLCLIALVFTAFAAAFLNSFLVLLFLEIIARKKDPEAEKASVGRLIISEASSWHGSSLKT
jgi:hypothetical protein